MKTMLDKAVVAGDITQPIDRRGAESVEETTETMTRYIAGDIEL